MVKLIPREIREAQFPEAGFLSGEEQARYEEACRGYGEKAKASLTIPIKGSNLFKVLKLSQIGIKTAGLLELELALENGLDLRGTYEDAPAVVLRSAGDSYERNDALAKSLAKLIKRKNFPHAVVIEGLNIEEDAESPYGLSFREGEQFRVVEAPAFDHSNNRKRFSRTNPDYTIEFDDNETRTLYTIDNGVSRLFLNRYLYLYSGNWDLDYSNDAGRVVVVSGEATSQKVLEQSIADIRATTEKQTQEIRERGRKAEHYVRTGKLE